MSSLSFDHLMRELPTTGVGGKNLLIFLEQQRRAGAFNRCYSLARMFDVADSISKTDLAVLLGWLVGRKIIDQVIRVEPEPGSGIGIADFASLEDVPDYLEDWRTGSGKFRVMPENLQLYYKLHPDWGD